MCARPTSAPGSVAEGCDAPLCWPGRSRGAGPGAAGLETVAAMGSGGTSVGGLPGRAARLAGRTPDPRGGPGRPAPRRGRHARGAARVEPDPGRRRVGRPGLAGRARGSRRRRARTAGLPRGDEPGAGPGAGQRDRRVQHRAGHHALRHRRAEGAVPRPHAAGRRDLVPGHVRARRRLGPGRAAHRRRGRRRRLRHERPEDVELHGPLRRLVPALRAHRPGGQEAPGHHVLPGRPAHAGHRGAAAHHHHRWPGLRRALPHRRPRPGLGHAGPAQRGLERGHDHAQPRARRRGPPAPLAGRTSSTTCWPTPAPARGGATRCCATGWPGSTRRSRACAG